MFELMYYGGLILSVATGILVVFLFFKLNMLEVLDYYFKINERFGVDIKKTTITKKRRSDVMMSNSSGETEMTLDSTTLLDDEINLESAKRYATTLLSNDYQELNEQTSGFVLEESISSTTLL